MKLQTGRSRYLSDSIWILILVFLCFNGVYAAEKQPTSPAGSIPSSMSPDIKGILDRGKLVVAMYHEDSPPFFMHDGDGKLVGIDAEIARDVADKLGVQVEFERSPKTYDDVVRLVFDGRADVGISALSDTLHRAKIVSFTVPYWSLKQALLINRLKLSANNKPNEQENLSLSLNRKGVRIGVISGSSYVDFATKDFPQAETVLYDSLAKGVADAKSGEIMAVLYDEVEIKNWNIRHPEDSLFLKTAFIPESNDTLAFAVGWGHEQLWHWLNLYIEKSRYALLKQLKQKYMQSD